MTKAQTKQVKIDTIKLNHDNPRFIKDDKFNKLKKSLKEFPEMLELRPIIVDENMTILGGNMRYRAVLDLGFKSVFITIAKGLTDEQKREFIIKDNASFGDWDFDILANDWSDIDLVDWGIDVWQEEKDVDYSILDDNEEIGDKLNSMAAGVKKAIMVEFDTENYEEAYELFKFWRERNANIGLMIMTYLKHEKNKL